ncbi:MAG: hypothetical protein II832_06010 [Synergistaceae bacterium]|nr:hypothetical protein [Synergistaceae bacterium]
MANDTTYPVTPEYVSDNLNSLKKLREVMNWQKIDVAKLLKIHPEHYSIGEASYSFLSITPYNDLSRVFDWEVWE